MNREIAKAKKVEAKHSKTRYREYTKPKVTPKKRHYTVIFSGIAVILVVGSLFFGAYVLFFKAPAPAPVDNSVVEQNLPADTPKTGNIKVFKGEEFRELYNNFAYPNTEYIADDAIITGDAKADAQIQKLAEARGYVRRSAPVSDNFVEVGKDLTLQRLAAEPWLDMQKAAKKDGIDLFLTAAYRSAAEQRQIFSERAAISSADLSLLANGDYDAKIDEVLAMTAIPGYSRHHTGYTIDIGCGNDPNTAFEFTTCFEWLSKENYLNAKTFGWIPSYPEGAGQQGPEPESWEYVWVGKDAVTE